MESWQTDILAAVEAAGEGLASAQDQLATAYRLALNHTVLTAAPMSESASIALIALRTAREQAAAVGRTRPESGGDFDGLALDLLYLLTCLELLKHAREAMASALGAHGRMRRVRNHPSGRRAIIGLSILADRQRKTI